jgi:hypothetical protein
MRFYFDIEDYEFSDYYGVDFKEEVLRSSINTLVENITRGVKNTSSPYSIASQQVEAIIKEYSDEIIQGVIEKVAEKIARKKAITSITPKASEIAAADEGNVAYFEQMIDRAIAKRFGGQ